MNHVPQVVSTRFRPGDMNLSRRPQILVFVRCYLPGSKSGGPIRSIANLVNAIGNEIDFKIVTTDRDSGDKSPYAGIQEGQWNRVENANVLYLASRHQTWRRLRQILAETDFDTIYLNSLFNPFFTLTPLLARCRDRLPQSVIIAPRGELHPGAIAVKHLKKRVFLTASRLLTLYHGVHWHATSGEESSHIQQWFGKRSRIKIIENLVASSEIDLRSTHRPRSNPIRLVFLSRIVPKKNLAGALSMLVDVNVPVELRVYGPLEDQAYVARCRKLASQLPSHIRVEFCGAVQHEKVRSVLSECDAFYFPTNGENFGHVVFEALSAACVPIISDRTPWQGLENAGIGWALPLSRPDRFRNAIEQCSKMDDATFLRMKQAAVDLASAQIQKNQSAANHYFEWFQEEAETTQQRA